MMVFLWSCFALGATLGDVQQALSLNDVPGAEKVLEALDSTESSEPNVVGMTARVHFWAGRYPEAYDTLQRAIELGWEDRWDNLALYERTLYTTANWTEVERGRFGVRYRPGLDAIIVDDAARTLQLAERNLAPLMGASPPGKTLLEVFPTTRSFIAASSLTTEDVHTTGVVALSKWSRLLLTSPRQMPRGYNWQDTVAHEYIHLVVSHNSGNEAPVWLQEAIAKYLDNRWKDGRDHFRLGVRAEGLLAEALRKDTLVSFEAMHPSLAKLPTPEMASLAYSQLSTLMAYSFEQGGEEVLLRVLPLVRDGVDPREALARGVGAEDFETLEQGWRAWVESQHLEEKRLAEPPLVLDGGDQLATDPLLAEREDLARFVTLGDLLRTEAGEPEAALVEYAKAVPEDEPPSPLLSNRMAQAHLALGRAPQAAELLERSVEDYPEFALSHKTLGQIYVAKQELGAALASYQASFSLQPFDPDVHEAMIRLLEQAGQSDEAARHQRYLRIRMRGGEDVVRAPLHTRVGDFELPTYDAHFKVERGAEAADTWRGEKAPSFTVVGMDGSALSLEEFAGKALLIDFWATWCGPCKKAIPELAEMHQRYASEGLVVLGLTDERRETVERFTRKTEIPYRLVLDADGRVKARYGVSALPTVFVVDRAGRVQDVVVGGGQGPRIETAVKEALGD
jgi:peroxiredoxin